MSGHPEFRRLWAASTVSGFGNYVTSLAVGALVVLTLDGGAADTGVVNAARWLPYLLLGVVAGALVDQMPRRPVVLAADFGRAVLLSAVPLLAAVGWLSLPSLAAVLFTFGMLSLFGDAAFQALVPRVVLRERLTTANARLDQSDAVAQASGPALAGALIALLGAPLAVLADAASFLVSGLLVLRIRVQEPALQPGRRTGLGREMAEGLRWVYRRGPLGALALGAHAWFLCWAVTGALLMPFALRTLDLGVGAVGLALALAGVGALVGSSVTVALGRRWGSGRVIIGCHLVMAVAWLVIALGPGWGALAVGQLLVGLNMGASNAHEMGLRQGLTPDALQGRVNASMRSVNRAMIVVGAPLGGWLGDQVGYRPVLTAAAVGFALVAVGLARSPAREARVTA